jgi:hypothetical protein
MLGAKVGPPKIGPYDPIPEILLHEADAWPVLDSPSEVRDDSGVIDKNIDPTETGYNLIHHLPNFVFISDIRRDRQRVGVYLPQLA